MRSWSIPAGKIFGVEVSLHLSFLLVLLFVGVNQQAARVIVSPWRGAALAGIIFGSIVLHELVYILLETRSGVAPRVIVLLPICGVRIFDETQPPLPTNWKRDASIAAVGPVVNFAVAGMS